MTDQEQLAAAMALQKFLVATRAAQYAALEFQESIAWATARGKIKKSFTEKAHYTAHVCKDTLRFFAKFVPTGEHEQILKDQTNANAALAAVLVDIARKVHEDHIEEFEKEVEAIALKYAYPDYKK